MSQITVIGSANVDLVVRVSHLPQIGETVIGGEFMQAMGGKGANQAVAAARLGADVRFIARVGEDAFADACLQSYRAAGVHVEAVQRTPDVATGIALIGVSEDGENLIMVASGANAMLTPADVRAHADAIIGADVILLQLESPLETVTAAVDIAHDHGNTIVLNPAPYQTLPKSLLQKISIITPNRGESAQMLGERDAVSDERLAKGVLGMGPQGAVITLGGEGALVAGSWGWVRVPAYDVTPVDTVGAGDAFNAGLAVALGEGASMEEAARFASGVAALAVTRPGAQPGMPTRDEVEAFLDGV
jgi:ribokinase